MYPIACWLNAVTWKPERARGIAVAVYTDVVAEDLAAFLAGYDIGELLAYKGIAEGVENSNFLVHTSRGYFILTLYEKRVAAADLPFFLGLMEHLHARGITCPQPVKNKRGEVLGQVAGRPGRHRSRSSTACGSGGRRPVIARRSATRWHGCISRASISAAAARNALSVDGWRPLYDSCSERANEVQRDLKPVSGGRTCPSGEGVAAESAARASSTPISFPTTCSSSATSSPA